MAALESRSMDVIQVARCEKVGKAQRGLFYWFLWLSMGGTYHPGGVKHLGKKQGRTRHDCKQNQFRMRPIEIFYHRFGSVFSHGRRI